MWHNYYGVKNTIVVIRHHLMIYVLRLKMSKTNLSASFKEYSEVRLEVPASKMHTPSDAVKFTISQSIISSLVSKPMIRSHEVFKPH